MKDDIIYNKFKDFLETYKDYFISNEELWNDSLEKVIKYIDEYNKTPSINDTNIEYKKIAYWLFAQKNNYKTKIKIMKDTIIYNKFKDFLETYKKYFISNEEIWNNNFQKVKKYIDDNNKRPSQKDKNKEIKTLGQWITAQQNKYKNKNLIMKTEEMYNKLTDFINDSKYKEYFLDNNIVWLNNLEKAKKYIDDNNKRPSKSDKDKEIKTLGIWLGTQIQNYKNKSDIMKIESIYYKWIDFINDLKYKEYFY
jgi:hypothetical protein